MRKKFKYHNNNTYALNPLEVKVSDKKLKELCPELYGISGLCISVALFFKGKNIKGRIKEHVKYGASEPAIVMSKSPLLIAAYSGDIDCVAILKFPDYLAEKYQLEEKSKLITVNTYFRENDYQSDLIPKWELDDGSGEENEDDSLNQNTYKCMWSGFHPIIAEFVSDDLSQIAKRKSQISDDEWEYVYQLGLEYLESKPNVYRDGNPYLSIGPLNG